ncbi:DUF4269 domain-containing protein [Kiloniella laminariae]|uniref:DUF4269 domain-containing protein n=1 Tax=Kiloniella laminariae TaxID=454162 RepID=A0ABT4LJG7_9PROT|nr:DUF4269 domain-containing protein [Kiloniella laminariae]MCZ4281257.1 DUF4269 domain-containing protein [Kiloniella laminariae]
MKRIMPTNYLQVLDNLELSSVLSAHEYAVIGTPPLGIAIDNSDIDIACFANDPDDLSQLLCAEYGKYQGYHVKNFHSPPYTTHVLNFVAQGWEVEFFIQNQPLNQQYGVRHFHIEKRLLALFGPAFRQSVIALKKRGIKTEPAFAQLLGIKGDPYINLLELENYSDSQLWGIYSYPK